LLWFQVSFVDVAATWLNVTKLIPHGRYNVHITARPKYAGLESDPTMTVVIMPLDGEYATGVTQAAYQYIVDVTV
jgi:hypothetical protein